MITATDLYHVKPTHDLTAQQARDMAAGYQRIADQLGEQSVQERNSKKRGASRRADALHEKRLRMAAIVGELLGAAEAEEASAQF